MVKNTMARGGGDLAREAARTRSGAMSAIQELELCPLFLGAGAELKSCEHIGWADFENTIQALVGAQLGHRR